MDKRKMTTYKLEVRPLTGLSINSGSTIDMASYVIEKDQCAVIDMNSFLFRILHSESDAQRHALTTALENATNDSTDLKEFVAENYKEEDVAYRSHLSQYTARKLLGNYGNLNINEIYRINTDEGNWPAIPGSSLKGAIRTAFSGNAICEIEKTKKDFFEKERADAEILHDNKQIMRLENEIDKKIFSSTIKDAGCKLENPRSVMRNLHISDCFPCDAKTEFVTLDMLGSIMTNALPVIDVICGKLMGSDSYFTGELRLCDVFGIQYPLTIDNIINGCNYFARNTFKKEQEKIIGSIRAKKENSAFELYDELETLIMNPLEKNEFLLKIGRFSQIEYVTYGEDFRFVKGTKNVDRKWGSTRTMMYDGSQYLPLGWCLCSIS